MGRPSGGRPRPRPEHRCPAPTGRHRGPARTAARGAGAARRPAGLGHPAGRAARGRRGRDAFATDMLVRRAPGELYALRHDIPRAGRARPVEGWVERLDPRRSRSSRRRRGCRPGRGGRAASRPTPTATCTWSSAAGRTG
jgi:hypothetical protein